MSTVGIFRCELIKCCVFKHCADFRQQSQDSPNIPESLESTGEIGFFGFADGSSQTVVTTYLAHLATEVSPILQGMRLLVVIFSVSLWSSIRISFTYDTTNGKPIL